MLLLALTLVLAVETPVLREDAAEGWRELEPGLALVFPRDNGAHPEYRTEWWYVTGELEDDTGARFGFQFTVFRRGLEPGAPRADESPLRARQVFAGHLALCDLARGETRFAERLQRGSPLAHASEEDLALVLGDWSLARGADDALALRAHDPERAFGFELKLRPAKPLVLHGARGYSQKGAAPGNASAYVSWTRLALDGRLHLDGVERRVRGAAWYDHEYGSSVLEEGTQGWEWFGLRLDDGRELMLFVLRDARGAPIPASAATLVERDGTPRALARADFTLAASGASWTNPATGARYPTAWRIEVPSAGLALEVAAEVEACELVSQATGVAYWEGPVRVRGSATGRGYGELTGFAGSMAGRF